MLTDLPFRFLLPALALAGLLWLGTALPGHAQRIAAAVDSTASVIDYTGSATMHDWTGTSRDVSGTVVVDLDTPDSSRALIQAPVASFKSGPDRRDRKMREVTEADRYPTVSFRTTEIRPTHWGRSQDGRAGRWDVTGDLTFHGQTHPVEATVNVRVTDDSVHARAQFPVSLTRFGVKRPRLLWVDPIADTIRIDARIAGARQDPPTAQRHLNTTRNDVTGTRRLASTDLQSLPTSGYAGTRAGLHTAVRRMVEGEREWIVSLYGFAEAPTGLADTQAVTLRADGQTVEPLRTIGSTRTFDDGTIVEVLELQVPRSGYERLATALTALASVGDTRFTLPWRARRDLRLILDRTPADGPGPVSSTSDAN